AVHRGRDRRILLAERVDHDRRAERPPEPLVAEARRRVEELDGIARAELDDREQPAERLDREERLTGLARVEAGHEGPRQLLRAGLAEAHDPARERDLRRQGEVSRLELGPPRDEAGVPVAGARVVRAPE